MLPLNNKRSGVASLTSIWLKDLASENPLKLENQHKDNIDERDELNPIKHDNDPCRDTSHQFPSVDTSIKMFNDWFLKTLKDRNNKEQKKVENK